MNITHVRLLTVPVSDQDRAKDFYTNTLGFGLVDERPVPIGENARWIQVAPKGAATAIVLASWVDGASKGVMLTSADLDGDCDRLRRAGVEVAGPQSLPWGRQATFADPDGNEFVLAATMDA